MSRKEDWPGAYQGPSQAPTASGGPFSLRHRLAGRINRDLLFAASSTNVPRRLGLLRRVNSARVALAFDERRSTRDIDAVFEPKRAVYQAAADLAEQRGLPDGWLNDEVKGFLAGEDPAAAPVLDLPGLRCLAASPQTLLALKVLAHRVGEDEDGLRLLADALGLQSADQVLEIAARTYGDRLDPAARFFVEQVFADR